MSMGGLTLIIECNKTKAKKKEGHVCNVRRCRKTPTRYLKKSINGMDLCVTCCDKHVPLFEDIFGLQTSKIRKYNSDGLCCIEGCTDKQTHVGVFYLSNFLSKGWDTRSKRGVEFEFQLCNTHMKDLERRYVVDENLIVLPVFKATRIDKYNVKIWCPICLDWHVHFINNIEGKAEFGHRFAGCKKGEYKKHGYFIDVMDENEMKQFHEEPDVDSILKDAHPIPTKYE